MGDFRHTWRLKTRILGEKERQSFEMAPDMNVQTEHSTTPGGRHSVALKHVEPLAQCREGKTKPSSFHCAWEAKYPAPGLPSAPFTKPYFKRKASN